MKKIALIVALLALVGGMLFLLPGMIDWSRHANALAKRLEADSGWVLALEGPVSGQFVPHPGFTLQQATLTHKRLGGALIKAPSIVVSLSLSDLLGWSIVPSSLVLTAPDITLPANREAMFAAVQAPIEVQLVEATLRTAGIQAPITTRLNAQFSPLAQGAMRFLIRWPQLDSTAGSNPKWLSLEGESNGPLGSEPVDVAVQLGEGDSSISLKGSMRLEQEDLRFAGSFTARSADPAQFLRRSLRRFSTLPADFVTPALEASGEAKFGEGSLVLEKAKLSWGTDVMEFTAAFGMNDAGASPHVQAPMQTQLDVKVAQATLEPYLTLIRAAAQPVDDGKPIDPLAPKLPSVVLPYDSALTLNLSAETLRYRDQPVTQVSLQADHLNGLWTLHQLNATLPGQTQSTSFGLLRAQEEGWIFNGETQLNGAQSRALVTWLGLDEALLPPAAEGILGAFDFHSNVAFTPDSLRFTEAGLTLDGNRIAGAALVYLRGKQGDSPVPEIEGSLAIQSLDVDRYVPISNFLRDPSPAQIPDEVFPGWLARLPLKLSLAMAGRQIQFRGLPFENLQARGVIAPGKIDVTAFRVGQEGMVLGGAFSLESAPIRPRGMLNLTLSQLSTPWVWRFLTGSEAAATAQPAAANAAPAAGDIWSNEPYQFRLLNMFDGPVALNIAQLNLSDSLVIAGMQAQGNLQNQSLTLDRMSGQLFNGEFKMRGVLSGGNLPTLEAAFILNQMDFQPLMNLKTDIQNVQARVGLSGSISSSGVSPRSMVANLSGAGSFYIDQLAIDGFDLNAIARRALAARTVNDVNNLARVAMASGASRIDRLEAKMALQQGLLQFPITAMETDYTKGGMQGTVDLNRLLMNIKLSFTPKSGGSEADPIPPVHLNLQGSINEPSRTLDATDLETFIANKTVRGR